VKRAFTLLELVLVVVIIGIISAVMVPRLSDTHIDKAAQQVLQHIRYTQHLAMMDNKFDPNDPNWFKKRWQIRFQYTGSSPRKQYYTIYADADADDVREQNEMAVNPLNPVQYMTGDKSYNSKVITQSMNLYDDYKITGVSLTGCTPGGVGSSQRLAFDYLGRPIIKNLNALDSVYMDGDKNENRLVTRDCTLTLTNDSYDFVAISIEPETGYAHISQIYRHQNY